MQKIWKDNIRDISMKKKETFMQSNQGNTSDLGKKAKAPTSTLDGK